MGFWMESPQKRGPPKMDLKFKKLCGNGNWIGKRTNLSETRKPHLFFLSQNFHLVGVPAPTTPLGRPGPRGKGATLLRRSQY